MCCKMADMSEEYIIYNSYNTSLQKVSIGKNGKNSCYPRKAALERSGWCRRQGLWQTALQLLFRAESARLADVVSYNATISCCEKGRGCCGRNRLQTAGEAASFG